MDRLTLWCATLAVVLSIASGMVSAQEPIVAIKVMPEEGVFKNSAWDKPLVIKSSEDAVKHFRKDAIETLGKEVDFKKQFLLVFAWRGSGGDKLSYAVAESWPEQIFFSLEPGLTRDLRGHTHVFALRSNVSWSAKGTGGTEGSIAVRPLTFQPSKDDFYIRFGGQSKVTAMESAAAVEELLGKVTAKQVLEAVDFTKAKVVLVSWSTSGPPEGSLKHEVKGEGKERRLIFYVQGPADAQIRGMRERIAANFFAVPKDLVVAFDTAERF